MSNVQYENAQLVVLRVNRHLKNMFRFASAKLYVDPEGYHAGVAHVGYSFDEEAIECSFDDAPYVVADRLRELAREIESAARGESSSCKREKRTRLLNHKCEDCGTLESVSVVFCPYAEDVHNKREEVALCDSCYRQRVNDI